MCASPLGTSPVLTWDHEKAECQKRPGGFLHNECGNYTPHPSLAFFGAVETPPSESGLGVEKWCQPWLVLQLMVDPIDVCHQGLWDPQESAWLISESQKLRMPQVLSTWTIRQTVTSITRWEGNS